MSEFSVNSNIKNQDFIIHILHNLPEEFVIILVGLENHLATTGPDVLTIKVKRDKLNTGKK